ncbi:MAG: bifunctional (p)ppGpp synthetase/guanosine-3',5'-bis(diphosphate) 3'-pyrophosphohydrolase [Chthonomonas sp.]|nr:bifunctional (p)ppGpp synthetase/guanosine-3',5'-bis(diphosphate) 3'-pyrophosphohydrolase [Chthonomonas sp.]
MNAFEIDHKWEDPEGLHDLLTSIRAKHPEANIKKIRYAYYVAEQAHRDQKRGSGEPYITHPLAVAQILVDLDMDEEAVVAALLHDVLEDSEDFTSQFLEEKFGEVVKDLVEGVTKLKLKQADGGARLTETTRAAETLRKMLLAMAQDIRVMVIKLADRLHNMGTLDGLPPEKRTRIANETLDIYAPLAARLGIWQIKWQLEDLAFKYLHPKEFQEISDLVGKKRIERTDQLNASIAILKDRLLGRGIKGVEVNGRPKHLYSIHNKMVKQGFKFEEILDLMAIRIIVPSVSDCYLALGIVHDIWLPMPGYFSDYIAKPKSNGYQSLHTKVFGPFEEPIEVQIRTREMHRVAEYGVAAHWSYKEGEEQKSQPGEFSRLREQLFDWSSDNRTSSDFLRTLSQDLFSEQVFAFTPKGDVIDLPAGSTPVDFAFRVHSSLGLKVVGAKVNGQMVQLNRELSNGDVVELVTRSNAQPSLDWLEFLKSANAKSKVRAHFRRLNKGDNAARGREALEKELKTLGIEPRELLGEDRLTALAREHYNSSDATDLLAKVGEGQITVQSVVLKLRGIVQPDKKADTLQVTKVASEGNTLKVTGSLEHMMIRRGKCCDPLPGEECVGYVSRGRGLLIHRKLCPNVLHYETKERERLIPMDWPSDGTPYPVQLRIISLNRQGLLMDVSTIFGESKTNVVAAKIRTLPNQTAEIEVVIEVRDIDHLNQLMVRIGNFSDVISLLRVFGRTVK